ncbi:MAG: alpha-glucosidase C-terminal domain-containing protein [Steroidobacter sp.]|nr:alpha-glucosidase C-terminal domain-containing protein [Steroidobacter sp.]
MRWRREQPALRYGDIRFVDAPEDALCFIREYQGQKLLACFNFARSARTVRLPDDGPIEVLTGHGFPHATWEQQRVTIPACGAFFAYLQ